MDAFDDQDLAVLLDLPAGITDQPGVAGRDFARFQRAAEGAGQSPGRRRDQVIQGGGVGFVDIRVDAVVLGDFRVNAENHRLRHLGQISAAQRALYALDPDAGCVGHFVCHGRISFQVS
jgi:hypothetical protein